MLIKKGGITRNIDPDRLSEYKAKGYEAVDAVETVVEPPAPSGEKQGGKPAKKADADRE